MMLVIAYDVDTTSSAGSQRLRKVARLCERHGIRVQNSVFEVLLDPAQLVALKAGLEKIICKEPDSIRIYRLGNSYRNRIEVIGRTGLIETGEPLLLPAPIAAAHSFPGDRRSELKCFPSKSG